MPHTVEEMGGAALPGDELVSDDDMPDSLTELEEEAQDIIQRMAEVAVQYREEHIEPDQVKATDYYMGRPFGNEEEGRSKVVSTDLRDSVMRIVPQVLRVFFGSERVVKFQPRRPDDAPGARQATDYVNYLVQEENNGFEAAEDVLIDGLVRRYGIFKWWAEDQARVEEYNLRDQTPMGVAFLSGDPDLSIIGIEAVGEMPDEFALAPEGGTKFDVRVRRVREEPLIRIASVPPEEFTWHPDSTSLDTSPAIFHSRLVAADTLLAMGVPEEMVEEARSKTPKTRAAQSTDLEMSRRIADELSVTPNTGQRGFESEEKPKAVDDVRYTEAWVLFDGDDDGIAELRFFQCVGDDYEIVPDEVTGERLGEVVASRPFSLFTPFREPHTIIGLSEYDLVGDVQLVKSQTMRAMLDSLGLAVDPQQEIVQGQVNMADLLDPTLGGVVRVRQPGMIREITHQFVGEETLAVLGYLDSVKEERSAQSKASAGLDPDALQSSTQAAVNATVTAAQLRTEMIARRFAEQAMKPLFKGILRLVVENQPQARIIRLRDEFVEINPASWDIGMDVKVDVALGSGMVEQRIATLVQQAQAQQQLMEAGAPFVSWVEIRSTWAKITELAGWKDVGQFWKPWDEQAEMQRQLALAQQPPPPDPVLIVAQAEAAKVEQRREEAMMKAQADLQKAFLDADHARDKLAAEISLKTAELQLKGFTATADVVAAQAADIRAEEDADLSRLERAVQLLTEPDPGAGGAGA